MSIFHSFSLQPKPYSSLMVTMMTCHSTRSMMKVQLLVYIILIMSIFHFFAKQPTKPYSLLMVTMMTCHSTRSSMKVYSYSYLEYEYIFRSFSIQPTKPYSLLMVTMMACHSTRSLMMVQLYYSYYLEGRNFLCFSIVGSQFYQRAKQQMQ